MPLTICVLASSSDGNCTYVSSGETSILIDAGLGLRDVEGRLRSIGADPARLKAICLSHEHSDHVAGMGPFQRKYGTPVYANAGTAEGASGSERHEGVQWKIFTTGSAFSIGDLELEPFSVPHDACDPVGFIITSATDRIGIATDLGVSTTVVRERLKVCRALVLEANHDEYLLKQSKRPWNLKQRILSRQGHLSNEAAAELLAEVAGPHLERVFLAHLSEECNEPTLALRTVREAMEARGHRHVHICLTYPDRPSEIWCSARAPEAAS